MYKGDAYQRALQRVYKDNIVALYDKEKDCYFTNSKSEPGSFHKVLVHNTQYICDCTGFWRTGLCKHIVAVYLLQKKLNHIFECEKCGQTYSVRNIPLSVEIYDLHMSGGCIK